MPSFLLFFLVALHIQTGTDLQLPTTRLLNNFSATNISWISFVLLFCHRPLQAFSSQFHFPACWVYTPSTNALTWYWGDISWIFDLSLFRFSFFFSPSFFLHLKLSLWCCCCTLPLGVAGNETGRVIVSCWSECCWWDMYLCVIFHTFPLCGWREEIGVLSFFFFLLLSVTI